MCGIVGLLIKDPDKQDLLGPLGTQMLTGMATRGCDSAGLAAYTAPVEEEAARKFSLYHPGGDFDWRGFAEAMGAHLGCEVELQAKGNHAVWHLHEGQRHRRGGKRGHFSAFMAQAGHLVVCGDAGEGLGDSLYEAVIYVRGKIRGFGADAQQESMTEDDYSTLAGMLERAGFEHHPEDFKRVASARQLYHWNAEHYQEY